MTVSFLQNFLPSTAEAHTPSGSQDYQPTRSAVCRKLPQNVTHTLTDGEREAAIGLAASLIEHHVELYEISGCFTDRANADRARLSMEALIAGRTNQPKESHDEQA